MDCKMFMHGSTIQQRKYGTSQNLGGGGRVLLQIQILERSYISILVIAKKLMTSAFGVYHGNQK